MRDAHARHTDTVARELGVDVARGVASADVDARRKRYGRNSLPQVKRRRIAKLVADQFLNIIVLLLAAASVIAWLTKDRLEAIAIAVVLVLNALIGFITEW
ncbi:MAG TPA: cation-transporting P-type ATPase, partial [Thermoanaerobaculia bacterium]|nr:cation-transporting P-type ATPase [Thermoanaerobaculia bacterium]